MNSFAFVTAIALCAVGCTSRGEPPPATSATASRAQPAHATPASHSAQAPAQPEAVELRHFYLLSPGPSSTLVVTRSETGTKTQ